MILICSKSQTKQPKESFIYKYCSDSGSFNRKPFLSEYFNIFLCYIINKKILNTIENYYGRKKILEDAEPGFFMSVNNSFEKCKNLFKTKLDQESLSYLESQTKVAVESRKIFTERKKLEQIIPYETKKTFEEFKQQYENETEEIKNEINSEEFKELFERVKAYDVIFTEKNEAEKILHEIFGRVLTTDEIKNIQKTFLQAFYIGICFWTFVIGGGFFSIYYFFVKKGKDVEKIDENKDKQNNNLPNVDDSETKDNNLPIVDDSEENQQFSLNY